MREREREREKKAWLEPELIVLVRSNPEEAVLTFCKCFETYPVGGMNEQEGGCHSVDGCGICELFCDS